MSNTEAPVSEHLCAYCQHVHGPLGCDAKSCGCGGAREHPGWPDDIALTVEVIPTSLHGKNPRQVFGQRWWDQQRRAVYRKAGYRCEICGGVGSRHPVEAHERFVYDETVTPPCQRVIGLIALCPQCHAVKHLYRTGEVSIEKNDPHIYQRALDHLARINGWDATTRSAYLAQVRADFKRREALGPWAQDFSALMGVQPSGEVNGQ